MSIAERARKFSKRPNRPIEKAPEPHKISVEQYLQMIEHGLFHPEEKVELIEGELINKMGIGEEHAKCVNKLMELFFKATMDKDYRISIQNPIRLEKSRPEPDLVVQTKASWEAKGDPEPKDIILVIEVAQSTLRFDREVKLPVYSKSAIPNYWIVNLDTKQVEVYTRPSGDAYDEKKVFKAGESIPFPQLNNDISVDKFLAE